MTRGAGNIARLLSQHSGSRLLECGLVEAGGVAEEAGWFERRIAGQNPVLVAADCSDVGGNDNGGWRRRARLHLVDGGQLPSPSRRRVNPLVRWNGSW